MASRRKALALFLLVAAFATSGCFESKTVVTRVSKHDAGRPHPKMNGVLFALPRTIVKADIPVIRERRSPGQFYALSPFFFPGEKFIEVVPTPPPTPTATPTPLPKHDFTPSDAAGLNFSLDDATFGSRGKPDPDETFMVSIRGGRFETKTLLLEVTEDGIVAKAEAESKDETIDFVTSAAKALTTIAAPLLPFGASLDKQFDNINRSLGSDPKLSAALAEFNEKQQKGAVTDEDRKKLLNALEDAFLSHLTEREKLIYHSLPQSYRDFLRDQITFEYLLQLTEPERDFFWTLSPAQIDYFTNLAASYKADLPRAKIAYDKIQSLIRAREDLVRSEPQPGSPADTLTKKLAELDTYFQSYREAYFIGKRAKSKWTGNFEVDPKPGDLETRLFDYSETMGICAEITHGIGGKTVKPPPNFMKKGDGACADSHGVILKLDVPAAQLAENLHNAEFDDSGERGFYYRIPAKVTARLLEESPVEGQRGQFKKDELLREEMSVAQLGRTASLPASTGGRRSSYKIVYYDATGAIHTLNVGSDALVQKSNAEDLEATATELRDAKVKKLKRETEAINAQKDKLEAEKALKKAQEDNANSNSNANSNN